MLSDNAKLIAESRYYEDGEDWEKLSIRVGNANAANEADKQKWSSLFAEEIYNMNFIPGGRILRNSGKVIQSMLNCACLPISDSIEAIGDAIKNALILWSYGAGLGMDFTPLREKNRPLRSKGGKSSGMVSFLEAFDNVAGTIETGGQRRSGCLGMCKVSHPDIFEFIDAKLIDKKLSYFNLSVAVDNEFLKAVENESDWNLTFAGQTVKTVKAKELWDKILDSMIKSGDPGLINYDNLTKNNSYYFQPISATNLCVSGDTLISTREGAYQIKDLVGRHAEVWDGNKWVICDNFMVTAKNQEMLKITLQDGSELRVTPYHKLYLDDGNKSEAKNISIGDKLEISDAPVSYGNVEERGAYIKGFLVGDGNFNSEKGYPQLYLYSTKYDCEDRLINSASEIPCGTLNTNAKSSVEFLNDRGTNRKLLRGLTARKDSLNPWVTLFKERLPKDVFQWTLNSKCQFIAGVFDSDGTSFDTPTAFGYQVSSIHKEWLKDFQILLKTLGINSKLGVMKLAGTKDFNDGYGAYLTQESYRLSLSQINSARLARLVRFSRLMDFSSKTLRYNIKPKWNEVVKIEKDGVDEKVYCCNLQTTHKLAISIGIMSGQCGELPLPAYGACDLGSLVLTKFLSGKSTNWKKLEQSIKIAIRFLDNILDVNFFPLKEMEMTTRDARRLGLGVMGLHDYLMAKQLRYGSDKAMLEVERLFRFIRDIAYITSVELAIEKGAFPKFSKNEYCNASYIRKLPAKIRMEIKQHGIRNCTILSCPPTGTTSLLPEVSSGIEPVFALAYKRADRVSTRYYIHPALIDFIKSGEKERPEWLVDVADLTSEDHFETQVGIQRYMDNSTSKTINCPKGTTSKDLSNLLLEYVADLVGITVYVDGSKSGQVLNKIDIEDIRKHVKDSEQNMSVSDVSCSRGTCEV